MVAARNRVATTTNGSAVPRSNTKWRSTMPMTTVYPTTTHLLGRAFGPDFCVSGAPCASATAIQNGAPT